MLNRRTLQRINEQPRSVNRLPLVVIGAGSLILALVPALLLSMPLPALGVLAAGALGVLGLYRSQRAKMVTTLTYDLDAETGARFNEVQEALESLASAKKIWRVSGQTGQRDPGRKPGATPGKATAPPGERQPVRVGRLKTPGIRANLPIRGIDASGQMIFFFPEAVLVLKERYTPVPYGSLDVAFSTERRMEEEEVPADAELVGRTWRYTRSDGSPDRRYASNPEIPVVLYGLLEISSPSGFEVVLLVSDKNAAAEFARTFETDTGTRDTGEETPGEEQREKRAYRSAAEIQEERRTEEALEILGVENGASEGEINVAYREMARMYHPDKVANQSPQVREYAEQRMKEINAAYALLKRRTDDHTEGA